MKKGYTLIEVLIALAVFALLAAISGSAIHHAFSTKERLNETASLINDIQLSLTLIERDCEQIISRAIRANELKLLPAFIGQSQYTEFTRDGLVNPLGHEQRSTLKRVAYLCKNGQLIRRTWARLDTPDHARFEDKVLLKNLKACSFAYLNQNRTVLENWHEVNKKNKEDEILPIAIRLNLNIKKLGKLSQLFIVPEALYGP